MAHPSSRLREFELQLAHDRRKRERETRNYGFDDSGRRRSRNTLGPQEDVIEHRRHRSHVVANPTYSSSTRSILTENIILLLFIAASIYGIYRLCIYILNL